MNTIKRNTFLLTAFLLFSLIFSSCATKISYNVVRPAQLDLNGAKTIAVLPIKPYETFTYLNTTSGFDFVFSSFFSAFDNAPYDEKRAISYLHDNIENKLINSPYIDVVTADSVQQALNKGYLNPADVYFTGEITYYYVHDGKEVNRIKVSTGRTDENGREIKKYKNVESFYREVTLTLRYQIVDSSNNKILCHNQISIDETSSRYDRHSDLPNAYKMIQGDLASVVNKIMKELQPYVVSKSVTLLEDKSKNPQMKTADELADDGYYSDSYKLFTKVYEETGLFEAGYNAALLQIVMGDFNKAQKLMNDLNEKFHDDRCISVLSDISYEINQKNKLKEQTEDSSGYVD